MARDTQGKQRDSSVEKRDVTSVTPSRAHAPSGSVTLSRRDNNRDDRDSTPLRCDAVTVTKSRGIVKSDKRFAGWIAGASQQQADRAEADLLNPEQRELFRICGERMLREARAGHQFSRAAMADAKRWAAYPPLGKPLSAGVPDDQLPLPLRGKALEVF